jgi:hypothetical protein
MRLWHPAVGLAVAGLLACTRAESQGGLTLEAKLPGGFAQVSNVIELPGGRVAFADTRNKLFLRADLGSGRVDTLGTRVDSLSPDASAELYKFPGWVAHLAGDTLALVDFSALRTTLWSEAGRSLKVLAIAPAGGKAPVLVYDTVGHGYKIDYQAVLGGGEPGRTLRPDSVPVLRIRFRDGAVDTVASLASPEFGDAKFGEQVQQAAKVFAPNDFFGVLPSGEAWVARGRENRVDWRTLEGRWSVGAGREYTRQPVTQTDRDRVLTQVREQGKQHGMPQDLPIEYPFAETKPPFEFALGRPNGEIWLQRPRSREDAQIVYDVVDRKGRWRREVAFPAGATLAGFGTTGAIYATIKNGDGTRTVRSRR